MTIEKITNKLKNEYSTFEIGLLITEIYYREICPYCMLQRAHVGHYVYDDSFLKKEVATRRKNKNENDGVSDLYEALQALYKKLWRESEQLHNNEKNALLFKSQEKEDEYVALANDIHDDNFLLDMANGYYTGELVKINYEKSLKYNEMSASINDMSEANNNLGYIYYYGRTGTVDYQKSLHYFEIASKFYPQAMYKIGDFYFFGKGVEKNYKLAHEYYLKSLSMMEERNNNDIYTLPDIYMRLASDYAEGYGTKPDFALANKYNTLAIELLEKRMKASNFTNFISNPAYKRCMKIKDLLKNKIQ